jgi:hypothetical protein
LAASFLQKINHCRGGMADGFAAEETGDPLYADDPDFLQG